MAKDKFNKSKMSQLPKDKALSDTKVEDEGYEYTDLSFPGRIGTDPRLSAAMREHVKR